MKHAAEAQKATRHGNAEGVAAHAKELGGMCQTCHAKYREKTETGFAIKKGLANPICRSLISGC